MRPSSNLGGESLRLVLRLLLGLILLSPFLIWLVQIDQWSLPAGDGLGLLILRTVGQASASSVLAIIFGVILFFCSEGFMRARAMAVAEVALLLPNILPPIFVILSLMALGLGSRYFPTGLAAVVLTHAIVNGGLVAVALRRIFQQKMGGMLELALVEGATRSRTFFGVAVPYIKGDIASLFLFVFSLCLASFSIPMVLGGVNASTFEIAIFQYIRQNGAWSQAVVLAAIQSLVLLTMSRFVPRLFSPARSSRTAIPFFAWTSLRYMTFLPLGILIFGWALGFQWVDDSYIEVSNVIVSAMLNTLILGLSVGMLHLILLIWVSYLHPHAGFSAFLNGYLVPSGVIIGFAFLLLPGESDNVLLLKMILGLGLWSFPILYRWMAHPMLESLNGQIAVARALGAAPGLILWKIVFPQCARSFFTAAGLASLWASGDFALTSILAGGQWTWALIIQDVIGTYRLNAASIMLIPLLIIGLICFGFFRGLGRYVSG